MGDHEEPSVAGVDPGIASEPGVDGFTDSTVARLGLSSPEGEELLQYIRALNADLGLLNGEHKRAVHEAETARQSATEEMHLAMGMMAKAAALRDDDTGAHVVRLGYLAEMLARMAGAPEMFAVHLRIASPMHDIGKLGIPDSILKKAGGLTPDERRVMNLHPALGANMFSALTHPLAEMAADVALCHHEKFDGTGYPAGLAGDQIPLSARIVSIIDFVDALTMDRCYRKALPDDLALKMLADASGTNFDPSLVAIFLGNSKQFLALRDRINREQPDVLKMAHGL